MRALAKLEIGPRKKGAQHAFDRVHAEPYCLIGIDAQKCADIPPLLIPVWLFADPGYFSG